MQYVLTIAGSDSCGGAGIQADIKTITRLKAHALTAITAVTAQNSMGVTAIHEVPIAFISRQIHTILDDISPHAVKIGMLMTQAAVQEVAKTLKYFRVSHGVIDPLLRASTGRNLLDPDALPVLKKALFPLAEVVTPNLEEAGILTNKNVQSLEDMEGAARDIQKWVPNVVVTGGHLQGECVDLLYDGKGVHLFSGHKIDTEHTHGSGCVFSTSLATFLAMGYNIVEATKQAHEWTRKAIAHGYPCGQGAGVVSLFK
jgi:hydroxymethylpyrimidine/phosphomethylpyrimidine kinase